jgi:Nif-specific regulatory protein
VAQPTPAYGCNAADSAEAVEAVAAIQAPDDDTERARLIEAMETAGWVQAKAARLLGLSARQIGYALRKHGVPVKKF